MQHLHGRSWMEIQTVDLEWYSRQEIHNGTGNNKRPMGLDALLENQFAWPLSNVPEVAHTLLFYPRGATLSYFHSMGSGFRDMGWFFKIALFEYWYESSTYMYTLFLPPGVVIEVIFTLCTAVSEKQADFQNCYNWAWNLVLAKVPELAHIGTILKLNLFSLYWRRFLRYRPIVKIIPISQGVEIELIFILWATVSRIQADFQNCHIWAWNLSIGQSSRSFTHIP